MVLLTKNPTLSFIWLEIRPKTVFRIICRDDVSAGLDLMYVNKNDLETSYVDNELLYRWSEIKVV